MSDSEVDSLEVFDSMRKRQIQNFYNNRCVFCLDKLVEEGSQCADILDASEKGVSQATLCSQLGIIPGDYQRESQENSIILCGRCHQLFLHDYIAFCPPKEILEFLLKYLKDTPVGERMPLHQVIYELTTFNPRGLPDTTAIMPYIGYYIIVHLKPAELQDVTISTCFSPPLSICRDGRWEEAPLQTTSSASNVARIFDYHAVNASGQSPSPGLIPLHPQHPHYSTKQYWRIPNASLGGMLSAVVLRAIFCPSKADKELDLVSLLYSDLTLQEIGESKRRREDEGGRSRRGGRRGKGTQKGAGDSRNTAVAARD